MKWIKDLLTGCFRGWLGIMVGHGYKELRELCRWSENIL